LIKDILDYSGKNVLELGCCMGLVATSLKKYRGVNRAIGVDGTDFFLKKQGSPHRIQAAQWFAQAFEANVQFIQTDLDSDPHYETKIGYDYDVVFCMSLLHWVQDKERLLHYLSHFNHVIFEGHDAPSVEIERFKRHGFDHHTIIGIADLQGKTIIHFYK
jgi:2-polyprenyl-3-methyl-5-hydroxy-6-metoxy-1,4-benzoquinol methylase